MFRTSPAGIAQICLREPAGHQHLWCGSRCYLLNSILDDPLGRGQHGLGGFALVKVAHEGNAQSLVVVALGVRSCALPPSPHVQLTVSPNDEVVANVNPA